MDNNLMILTLISLNVLLTLIAVGALLWNRSREKKLQKHFDEIKEGFNRQMGENRMEINHNLQGQFRTVFDTLRTSSKDQNEVLKDFGRLFRENVREFNDLQREKFGDLVGKQERMLQSTEERLDKMRETVDEKLQKTLEERIGKSFETVTRQLLAVQKGLGEMQSLAAGVGDLKRVLSNVKSRGVLGEYQLEAILENILSPDQFEANVAIGTRSSERVEFVVKLPGNQIGEPV